MPRTRNISVCVAGEAGVGKSYLVNSLLRKTLTESRSSGSMWSGQFGGSAGRLKEQQNDATFNLSLKEVVGSRGRMSNSRSLMEAVKSADIVLYCVPMNAKVNWRASGLNRILNMMHSSKNNTCVVMVIGTHADQTHSEFNAAEDELLKNFPFYATSATTREGLDKLPAAIVTEVHNGSPAVEFSSERKRLADEEAAKKLQEQELAKKEVNTKAKEDIKSALAAWMGTEDEGLPASKKLKADSGETMDIAPVA